MKEDIEMLEKLLKDVKQTSSYDKISHYKALENLITRYKEIKKEHKIMKRILVEHNLWETLLNDDEFIKYLREE